MVKILSECMCFLLMQELPLACVSYIILTQICNSKKLSFCQNFVPDKIVDDHFMSALCVIIYDGVAIMKIQLIENNINFL